MLERALLSAALAAVLWLLLEPDPSSPARRRAAAGLLLAALAWVFLDWARSVRGFPSAFPQPLSPERALFDELA
ncbi:MAG: hypothetical protein KGM24_02405, partial [Elusimicrobia bacterium]|nr:hypothetical protein [Elusimicrobiota bacterium]